MNSRPDFIKTEVDKKTAQILLESLGQVDIHHISLIGTEELVPINVIAIGKDRILCATSRLLSGREGEFQFNKDDEVFYFKTTFSQRGPELILDRPHKIYKLQRREYFRLPLPQNGPVKVFMKDDNNNDLMIRVLDISCGGLKILCPAQPHWRAEDERAMLIQFENEQPVMMMVQFRHMKTSSLVKDSQEIGVQFMNLSQREMNALYTKVMLLYRKLYLRQPHVA